MKYLVIGYGDLFTCSDNAETLEAAKAISERLIKLGYNKVDIFEKKLTAAIKEPEVTFTGV